MKTQILYRKLNPGETILDGDVTNINGYMRTLDPHYIGHPAKGAHSFRPVTITEGEPEKPKKKEHRVEDETWKQTEHGEHICLDPVGRIVGDIVCHPPSICEDESLKLWPKRRKRIIAGQEALKFVESFPKHYTDPRVTRILAMLKD